MVKMILGRICLVVTLFMMIGPAVAQSRGAAFVADFDSGEVLHARMADAQRYPASLTKMMTLYMLFEELQSGDLRLTDQLIASSEAASRPPSDLALSAGD